MRTFALGQFGRTSYQVTVVIAVLLCFFTTCICAEPDMTTKPSPADIIRSAAAQGKLLFKLTEPNELKSLLGAPAAENTKDGGGMEILFISYPGIKATFGKLRKFSAPFTLLSVILNGRNLDIGEERPIVLRDENDLK